MVLVSFFFSALIVLICLVKSLFGGTKQAFQNVKLIYFIKWVRMSRTVLYKQDNCVSSYVHNINILKIQIVI